MANKVVLLLNILVVVSIMFEVLLDARRYSDSILWNYSRPSVCLSACLSIRLSIRPSLNFAKIGSLVFSNIKHDDSWSWHLVTDKARFLKKKKINCPNLGSTDLNQVQYGFFLPFSWVWIIKFPWNRMG